MSTPSNELVKLTVTCQEFPLMFDLVLQKCGDQPK